MYLFQLLPFLLKPFSLLSSTLALRHPLIRVYTHTHFKLFSSGERTFPLFLWSHLRRSHFPRLLTHTAPCYLILNIITTTFCCCCCLYVLFFTFYPYSYRRVLTNWAYIAKHTIYTDYAIAHETSNKSIRRRNKNLSTYFLLCCGCLPACQPLMLMMLLTFGLALRPLFFFFVHILSVRESLSVIFHVCVCPFIIIITRGWELCNYCPHCSHIGVCFTLFPHNNDCYSSLFFATRQTSNQYWLEDQNTQNMNII